MGKHLVELNAPPAWLAVYTAPNQEIVAQRNLLRLGTEVFFPYQRMHRFEKRGSRTVVMLRIRAYFPGYIFSRVSNDCLGQLKYLPGIIGVVNCQGKPLPIPDGVIQCIRDQGDETGCLGTLDFISRRGKFKIKIGERFLLKNNNHILGGLCARLSSLARLDSHGEVEAFVHFLGSEREIRVPESYIGDVVMDSPRSSKLSFQNGLLR